VQIGDQTLHPKAGEELWIPANTRHRLAAADRPVRVLEIAFGNWQQAVIMRFADDYTRPAEGE
jgi:mannose-1-phosphate guanylyltransferase/mannose-6-phosphate isomerase